MGKVENRRHNLEQKVSRHLIHMSNLIRDPFPHDAHAYREEHAKLEAAMADFVKDSRNLKTEIFGLARRVRSEEHTSELQSLMRRSYAVFCLKKKKNKHN